MQQIGLLLLLLIMGAITIALGLAVVLIDRINFPQRKFKAKQVPTNTPRDRTGAHIKTVAKKR